MGTGFRVLLVSIGICICIFYFDAAYFLTWPFKGWQPERLGQFGDAWGVLTSVFSVLAFFGVLFSLKSQMESAKQAEKSMEKQIRSLALQNFESNLFQMLKMHSNIINEIDISRFDSSSATTRKIERGRDGLHAIYSKFKSRYNDRLAIDYEKEEHVKNLISMKFEDVYNEHQQDLGHYFRFLYNIFRYLDEADVDEDKKVLYSKIIRAQISNFELMLLFYSSFFPLGVGFVKYIVKYSLLDNMPYNELVDKKHVCLFEAKAFGNSERYEELIKKHGVYN